MQVDVREQRRDDAALRRARHRRASTARPPSHLPRATAAAASAPAGPRCAAPPASAAWRGRCCRSSRGCRRPARGCRRARHARAGFPVPASRSASAETHTTTAGNPPRRSAPARASPPSAPLGLGPSECRAAAAGHRPSGCIAAGPAADDTCLRAARRRARRADAPRPYCSTAAERHRIDPRRAAVPLHPPPCLPEDVTPPDPIHQGMEAALRGSLGRDPESTLQLAHFVDGRAPTGVVGTGPAGHALARACAANVTTAGTLRSPRVVRREARHYYGPLGRPLRHARFRRRLIRAALPRPGPRRRASRVPFLSVPACCAPYPAETCRACTSGLRRGRRGLRRDMTGSALGL